MLIGRIENSTKPGVQDVDKHLENKGERLVRVTEDGCARVLDWPFTDIDVTLTWVGGKPTSIVYTGHGKTKTLTLTWDGDELDSVACVIT